MHDLTLASEIQALTDRLHGNAAIDLFGDGRAAVEVAQLATGRMGYYIAESPLLAVRKAARLTADWPSCPCGNHESI